MKKHLSDLVVSKLLCLPHRHVIYAFNYLVDYLDKAEITGQVRASLQQHGFKPLLLYLVTWHGDGKFAQYTDPEIRSLTSIALYLRAPTMLWFEDRSTTPPTLTHAIYQPHLHPDAMGFQMTVERVPTSYVLQHLCAADGPPQPGGHAGKRRLKLVDPGGRSLDAAPALQPLELSAEETGWCLELLDAGIPYVHAYHADGRPVVAAEREYQAHAEGARTRFLVVYPNRRVWALPPKHTAAGAVRIRSTRSERKFSPHYTAPPFAF
jgi:hypothetical protein